MMDERIKTMPIDKTLHFYEEYVSENVAVCVYDIWWNTDGQEVEGLPRDVLIPGEELSSRDVEDYLYDTEEWPANDYGAELQAVNNN